MIYLLEVTPALNTEQLEDLKYQLLSPAHGRVIERSTRLLCNGELKALYLRQHDYHPIGDWSYQFALDALERMKFDPAKNSERPMIYQSCIGGDLLAGWLRPRNPSREDWLRKADRDQFMPILAIAVMLLDVHVALAEHLPEYYWQVHIPAAETLVRTDILKTLHKIPNPWQRAWFPVMDYFADHYHFHHLPFSTITLNHNILFGAHQDGNNVPGTLSCMTALGNYQGGVLCFPRLGVSFDLRPGDLLIADTNEEYHGTVGGIIGSRYSIVAYLHKSLVTQ